jgi:hypothetical protein
VLQFVIQNYIINHDKILAKIEENRKKPKTKSKSGKNGANGRSGWSKCRNSKTRQVATFVIFWL